MRFDLINMVHIFQRKILLTNTIFYPYSLGILKTIKVEHKGYLELKNHRQTSTPLNKLCHYNMNIQLLLVVQYIAYEINCSMSKDLARYREIHFAL